MILRLAFKSLFNRRLTTALTILSVALSVALLIGVERVRLGARDSFAGTISKTDLIVGARGGQIQLLLYAVFRMGNATNNVSYATYRHFAEHPLVAWTIPYSLGDSHRGFRVVGTTDAFYEHYRYRGETRVRFASGRPPENPLEVVLGSKVASRLGYELGQAIVLAHGIVEDGQAIQQHDDKPFKVSGILEPTGTPIDQSLYVTLEGMEALHMDWSDGAPPLPGQGVSAEEVLSRPIEIHQITAFLVGAKSRFDTLSLQREINEHAGEPLMAIIPGVALSEFWQTVSYAENGLRIVSAFVVVVGLTGMLLAIYNSLNERRREMAILRSLGAGPRVIFALLIAESVVLTFLGSVLGVLGMYGLFVGMRPWVSREFGLDLPIAAPSTLEWLYLGTVLGIGFLLGAVPAYRAYRNTLTDGLTIRI